jgi:hypothetical protein
MQYDVLQELLYVIGKYWLGGDHFILRDFGPYDIIFMMCV